MFLQLLQRNADYRPDATAIDYGDESITHAVLHDRVERCARGLLSLGVNPGDRVALFLENSPEYITSFFAVAACRAVNVPLNLQFKEEEILFFLSDAGVRCIIVDAPRAAIAANAVAKAPQQIEIVVKGQELPGTRPLASLIDNELDIALPNGSLDDDVIYIYSSGTTGRPKCAPRTVVQYWWEMNNVIEGLQVSRNDTILNILPLFHNFGSVHCMLVAVGSGARLLMLKNPNPFALRRAEALRLLESEKVTIFPGVPLMFDCLIESTADANLSSVRVCYSAAAALSKQTAATFLQKFGVPIRDHYGCTEVGAMTINLDPDPSEYGESVGKPFPGVRIKILDDDEQILPVGEVGEIAVGGRAMTRGYLGLDDTNSQTFKGGYFHTGDLGRLDEDGRLYLLGRKKLVIDVVGHKVSPIEVEDALHQHPRVVDAVVMGVPNPRGNDQIVVAYVVVDRTIAAGELLAFCKGKLANFKVPESIEFISQVPRNALGKVVRQLDVIERHIITNQEAPLVAEKR